MHISSKRRNELIRKGRKGLALFLAVVLAIQCANLPIIVSAATDGGEALASVEDTPAPEQTPAEQAASAEESTPAPASVEESAPVETTPVETTPAAPAEPSEPVEPEQPAVADQTPAAPANTTPAEPEQSATTEASAPATTEQNTSASAPAESNSATSTPAPTEDTTATVTLALNQSTLAYEGTTYTSDQTQLEAPANQELKFTVAPTDGFEIDTVKQVAADGAETELTADANGEYTIAADKVADGLKIDVATTEAPAEPAEEPADDATTEPTEEPAVEESSEEDAVENPEESDGTVTLSVEVENSTVTLTNAEGEEQTISESQDVEVAADEDLALTVEPAEDYELEGVTVTDADETSEVSGEDGVYTIPADQVIEGSNIQVSAVTAAKAQATRAATANMTVGDTREETCNSGGWHSHDWWSDNPSVASVSTHSGWFGSQQDTQTVTAKNPGMANIYCDDTLILTVYVEASEITVTFDPNGGQGEHFTKTTSEIENGNYRMSLPTLEESGFSRDGYTFVGWSIDRTGEGQTYTPQEITVSNGQTYYAIWAKNDAEGEVRAEFFLRIRGDIPYEPDANIGGGGAGYFPGGCGTGMWGSIKQGVAINNNNALVAANINEAPSDATIQTKIQEWNRTHAGSDKMSYNPETQEIVWYVIKKSGDHYHVDGVIVDKAEHWVSYNPNGGTSHVPTGKKYMEGAIVDVDFTATPSKAGYTFLGWDTDPSATTPTYTEDGTNSFEMPGSNVTLYAIWQEKNAVIYTYAASPAAGGTLTKTRESVNPATGNPEGSVATAGEYYRFDGWFNSKNELITQDNAAENGVQLEGNKLTPIKNDEGVFTGGSFTAKFTQVTFDGDAITVKVEKDGTPIPANGNVGATEYKAGGGTDNFKATPDGYNLEITYTYDNLNCADIALTIDVPVGYDVEVESDKTDDTVGKVDSSKVAKFELKGSGDSWTLNNVPGGATVTVKLTKKTFTVNYAAEDGGQVDPKSETVKYGEDANGSVATPNDGYYFVNWTDADGTQVSTDEKFAPQSVKENATYTAHFAKKMEVSITGKSATDLVYNGSEQTVSGFEGETEDGVPVHVDGQTYFVGGATSTASGTNAMDEAENTVINKDNLQVFDVDGNNVTDRFTVTVNPGKFKINKRVITVTDAKSVPYSGSEQALVIGEGDEGQYKVDGTAAAGEELVVTAKVTGTEVGPYTQVVGTGEGGAVWSIEGGKASNYDVTVSGTLTINAQSIDPGEDPENPDNPAFSGATVNYPQNVTYNGTDQAWLPTVVDGQGNTLIKDVDYTVSYDGDTKNVRHIVVTITGIGDYEGTVTREYNITPATITVTANNLSKTQGQADPALTSTYEGAVAGEIPGWTGYISRAAGEAPGQYAIGQNTLQLADGENGFLANNYTLVFNGATFTINPLPGGGGDGGDGGDGGTTPTGPTPTPTNPTPGPGATTTIATGVATGVIAGALTDDAADAETIDDDETPLASGTETIDDDATPLASGREDRQCWVHWFMFIGMAISAVYYIGALIHRRSFTSGLKNFEDEVLNPNDQNNA